MEINREIKRQILQKILLNQRILLNQQIHLNQMANAHQQMLRSQTKANSKVVSLHDDVVIENFNHANVSII